MEQTKVCSGCGVEKPLSDYYKEKKGKYGVKGKCCTCTNIVKRKYKRRKASEKAIGKTCCYCDKWITKANSVFVKNYGTDARYAHIDCCRIELAREERANKEAAKSHKNRRKKFYKWLDKTGQLDDVLTPRRFVSEDELASMSNHFTKYNWRGETIYNIPVFSYSFYPKHVGTIQREGFYRVEEGDNNAGGFTQYYNGGYPSSKTDLWKQFVIDKRKECASGERIRQARLAKKRELNEIIEQVNESNRKRIEVLRRRSEAGRKWRAEKRAEETFFAGLMLAGGINK